ncbi:hypothetical protein DHEL01_v208862 [Diaporthe helianthi]|uniref:Uncharacterized protein n=1 Tax=Diaporthe helianthi TaxID=158607 RepID=A0A2P5HR46_DIAHE|nr:hypothetical protein DHEL01_v208862 [Diaporthe helianthi]
MSTTHQTPNKPKSDSPPMEENPITPPRPRVICPGCSTELELYKTFGTNEASIYASKVDMKKLGIDCQNEACPIYLEGIGAINTKAQANPNIAKYVQMARKERAAMDAAQKQSKEQMEKRKLEKEKAEYAKYDPFSRAAEEKRKEAAREGGTMARLQQQMKEEREMSGGDWEGILDGMQANLDKFPKGKGEKGRRSRHE